jgi:hypothetical protein
METDITEKVLMHYRIQEVVVVVLVAVVLQMQRMVWLLLRV